MTTPPADEEKIIRNYWPTPVGVFHNPEHPRIKDDLIGFLKRHKEENPQSKQGKMNIKLYESRYDIFTQEDENLHRVAAFLASSILETAMEANKDSVLPKLKPENLSVNVIDSWFIIYEQGGFVAPHYHHSCSWSCVYYVQSDDVSKIDENSKNGATYLMREGSKAISHDLGAFHLGAQVQTFAPKEGRLVIWPSHVMHGSFPYEGEKNRIIISCNVTISQKQILKQSLTTQAGIHVNLGR